MLYMMFLRNILLLVVLVTTGANVGASTDTCTDLAPSFAECKPYRCAFDGESAKQVVGWFPEGCRYVEYLTGRTVKCTLPEEALSGIARETLVNQEDVSVLQIEGFMEKFSSYCEVNEIYQSPTLTKEFSTMNEISANLEKGYASYRPKSLFFTEEQLKAIEKNLERIKNPA
jgi:hypothetical protein